MLLAVKGVWLTIMITALVDVLRHIEENPASAILIGWFMIVAGFPLSFLGLICCAGFAVVAQGINDGVVSIRVYAFISWVIMSAFGYLQWFVIIPFLIKSWKERAK